MTEFKERLKIPTSFSVALLAEHHDIGFDGSTLLLVKNNEGQWAPLSGNMDPRENPLNALKREWSEETDGLPFRFQHPIVLEDTLLVRENMEMSVGFIFKATLTDQLANLLKRGRAITKDEDVVEARLMNYGDIVKILESWQTKLKHPELNAHTLITWCNRLTRSHNSFFMPGVDDSFTQQYFGMDFEVVSLSSLANKL